MKPIIPKYVKQRYLLFNFSVTWFHAPKLSMLILNTIIKTIPHQVSKSFPPYAHAGQHIFLVVFHSL